MVTSERLPCASLCATFLMHQKSPPGSAGVNATARSSRPGSFGTEAFLFSVLKFSRIAFEQLH